ncbi:MAG: exosortase A [Candidatus Accumulibacter sp.]|jgi:exosortase A|nr:exosortase A [Accumulibacter sp.]
MTEAPPVPARAGRDDAARWSRGWRAAWPALLLALLAALFLFRHTLMAMAGIWARSETFAHGFLIAPLSAWLIWRIRRRLASMTPRPDRRTIALLLAGSFAWLLGQLATVGVAAQFSLVTLVILIVPAILGWRIAWNMAFPLLFLYFSVPFGEFAMPKLMEWTAMFTVIGLRLSGVPVFHEGLRFVIPSGSWSVVEACSGVRYIIASLSLGTLFAYLNYRSPKRRLAFVAVSLVVPVLANWLRAYLIVMLGHLSGNALASGVDHLIYGWLFFGVVILLMFAIGGRWSDADRSGKPDEPVQTAPEIAAPPAGAYWKSAAIAALALAAAPLGEWYLLRRAAAPPPVFPDMTRLEDGWQAGGAMPGPEWKPAYGHPSAEQNRLYSARGQTVGLYIAYYRQQNHERKLISSENVLVKSHDRVWTQVASGSVDMMFSGRSARMRSAELRAGGADGEARLVTRLFFWIDGRLTASDVEAKLLTALALLGGRGDDSAVIVLYAQKSRDNGGDGGDGGEVALRSFVEANSARLLGVLDAMRAKR